MATSTTSFCEQCGASNDASARFCAECGAEQPILGSSHEPASIQTPPGFGGIGAAGVTSAGPNSSIAADLPMVAGLPVELWLVIAAFAIPGGWIAFDVVKALPDAIKAFGAEFFGFRFGLALMMILLLVGLLGAAMLAIAWRLYRRDRVGRGLAYAFAGTIVVSVALSNDGTTAETLAMVFSLVGIAILGLAPRVRDVFDRSAAPDGAPTSVVVSRTAIAIFSAIAIMCTVIYLLLASASAKYIFAALVAGGAAFLAMTWSKRLTHADRRARLYLSVGGAIVAILLLVLGRFSAGLLFPLGVIVSAVAALWLPNDARTFFGDDPLNVRPQ
jgi:hypothetical protein